MADRRLVWNQLQAPDLSAASAAIARANQSFNSGFEGGASLLQKYGEGQQAKADDEILAEIAGLGDEAEFDSFIDGGNLANRNISSAMRDHILGLRTGLVNDDGVRARTAGTRSATAIREAGESRNAAEYLDKVNSRDAARGLAGEFGAAQEFAGQYGNTVGGITETTGGGDVQRRVYQGLLDRGLPEHVAQGFMMNFQDESGFNINVTEAQDNVHGTRGKGLYQLTGARRDAFEAKYGNDYSVDNQLDFLVEELGGSESGARDAIFATGNAGDAGAAIVSRFLRPAEEHRVSRSNRYRGTTFDVPTGGTTTERASPVQAYRQALVETGQFTGPQINAMMADIQGTADNREAELVTANNQATAEAEAERRATALIGAVQNPNNLTPVDAGRDLLTGDGTATERLGDVAAIENALAGSPALQGALAPEVAGDPSLAANVDNSIAAAQSQLDSTDQSRAIGDIQRYQEDPAASLTEDLGLGTDGQSPTSITGLRNEIGFDQNRLRNMINDYAREFQVEPSVVAVAMRDAFVRDPSGRNTLANRFDRDAVEAAVGQLSQERIGAHREGTSNVRLMEQEMRSVQASATQLRQQIAKTPEGPQREALEAQLAAVDVQIASIEARRRNLPAQGQ